MLQIAHEFSTSLLEATTDRLHEALSGPTLIHLPGRRPEPLFVSVLLHGNEDTGWYAIQALMRKYRNRELPRALSIFIGNVAAGRVGVRFLDGQPDYNRIWEEHSEVSGFPEHAMMRRVIEEMRIRRVFASIDVHNNTGVNPHYACVNRLDQRFFQLATLFSRTVVYFTRPRGVQTAAFAGLCPAVTVECGQAGQAYGVEHAAEYLEACLNLAAIPEHKVAPHDIDLFHSVAIVKVPIDVNFGFGDTSADIRFSDRLDRMNFRELPAGTVLGWVKSGKNVSLDVRDDQGVEVGGNYLKIENGEIRTITPVMPSMLSSDAEAIRKDCLCYFMERHSGC